MERSSGDSYWTQETQDQEVTSFSSRGVQILIRKLERFVG
jgi:hypothetical protein